MVVPCDENISKEYFKRPLQLQKKTKKSVLGVLYDKRLSLMFVRCFMAWAMTLEFSLRWGT